MLKPVVVTSLATFIIAGLVGCTNTSSPSSTSDSTTTSVEAPQQNDDPTQGWTDAFYTDGRRGVIKRCDGPNLVYENIWSNSISVSPNDPQCVGQ